MTYSAIGHSHLDLLFLWPERETWRKCARTLSTVVKMMDRFPEYRFCLSQARQKKWNRRLEQALHTLEWLASLPWPGWENRTLTNGYSSAGRT